jgi:hypothetical protein
VKDAEFTRHSDWLAESKSLGPGEPATVSILGQPNQSQTRLSSDRDF